MIRNQKKIRVSIHKLKKIRLSNTESAKWRPCVMLYMLGLLTCLACSRSLRTLVFGVLKHLRVWRALRASKNGVVGVLHKMACLKWLNSFLGVFDHRALVNLGSDCEIMYSMGSRLVLNLS